MQARQTDEAPDQCPECDAETWSDVQFWIDGAEGRMCMTCGRIERRCRTGHWTPCEDTIRDGFCVPCTDRRAA
jgi:hypothetical protein